MLPAVVDTATADQAKTAVHDIAPNNVCYVWGCGDKAATDAAFAKAAHVTKLSFANNRLIPNAIEPRAANAAYDRGGDSYTLYVANQNPHVERLLMTAFVLGLPEHKVRVVAPDVGGGFGSKIFLYAEETALVWASKRVGRPIKWTAERSESFLSDAHGRDHVTTAELALDKDGKFLALRVHTTANLGAYLSTFASCVPTILYATLLAGQYTTPAIYCEVKAVFTNTAPVDAVRGAGRPEATYVVERIVETAARELKIDPAELRRRNFIKTFPYATPVGLTYDTGDYDATLRTRATRWPTSRDSRRARLRARRRACCAGSDTPATSRPAAWRRRTSPARSGRAPGCSKRARCACIRPARSRCSPARTQHGQGHETTFSQVVADRLGIPLEDVDIQHGDTGKVLFGMGTYGSRSIAVGGTAIMKAIDKVDRQGQEDRGAPAGGRAKPTSSLRTASSVSPAPTARRPSPRSRWRPTCRTTIRSTSSSPGLNENAFYDPTNFTYPAGSYICEVEVDPATGVVRIDRFTACDDFGNVINPMIVEGQVHGGVAHGIGQALLEHSIYNEDGQLVTGSFMDYAMPRADDLPSIKVETVKGTPCTHNPLGVKGCGEAGAIGSPAAVINAVTDALWHLGVKDVPMPASPHTVWKTIRAPPAD